MDNPLLHSQEWTRTSDTGFKSMVKESKKAIFTVDLEDYYHALCSAKDWEHYEDRIKEPSYFLLDLLEKYGIKAHWYALGIVAKQHQELIWHIATRGHKVGSHGYWHEHGCEMGDSSDISARNAIENVVGKCIGFRSPYWDTTPRPGYGGGAYFRILPLWFTTREVKRTGQFWIHPHDLDEGQPRLKGAPWWRYIGIKGARGKLEKLLERIEWRDA